MTFPHYSGLSQPDMDRLSELVTRVGYGPVIAALGDILTQASNLGMTKAPQLSLTLGMATAEARELDRMYPPGASTGDT